MEKNKNTESKKKAEKYLDNKCKKPIKPEL
jgi:hypothetical protein